MSNSDYLPKSDRPFLAWVVNFLKYLFPSLTRIGFPNDKYQELAAQRNDFAEKLEVADEPATRTKTTIELKNEAHKALKTNIRQAVQEYLAHNHNVTNADRDNMGLPIYKTGRTPSLVPSDPPQCSAKPLLGNRVEVTFHALDENTKRSVAKPAGVHGVEIAWAVLAEAPKDYEELIHSEFDTCSPYVFQFKLSDAGKILYFALRWENTRGKKGPWTTIQSIVIP
jgi:hypothetical protein